MQRALRKNTTTIHQATMPGKHQAAVLPSAGSVLSIIDRNTPEPGPDEVLIETKAIAVNPVDYYQRDFGKPPTPFYPAVLGVDVAGLVVKVGSNVSNAPPPGSRILAFASSFYQNGSPDHGAFQKYTVARSEGVIPLPDTLSFEEGAILPLAVLTALSAYTTLGIPLDTKYTPEDKQAILIWGASSSVGSLAVQSAKIMGFAVYATAGAQNLEYVKTLGANAVFNYKSSDVVSQIANKAREDGVSLRTAHVIVDNALQQTLDVLKHTKGDGLAKVAHAPLIPEDAPTLEGTEIRFTSPPTDPDERNKHIYKCFNIWLTDGLSSGTVVPSPRIQVVPGGIGGLNDALDTLKAGVSGTKVIVSV
jgi:NADPH:quinone reductase-like Zn-dependent oxidoreductase